MTLGLGSLLTLSCALCSDMEDRGEREANDMRKKRETIGRERERQPERAREHDSIKEFISNSLPPHEGADLDP